MERMTVDMEAKLEMILKGQTPLLVWEWDLLDDCIDYFDSVIDACNPDWDSDVLDYCTAQLDRIVKRLETSIRLKQRLERPMRLVG